MEKIQIINFAGLDSIEFQFKAINILIGPQGSGKSITVKLLYFFKSFFSEIVRSIQADESKREFDTKQKEKFVTFFPKDTWPEGDFMIIYSLEDVILDLSRRGNRIQFEYSENLINAIAQTRKVYADEKKKVSIDPKINAYTKQRDLREKLEKQLISKISGLSEIFKYSQFFIPAGRSFFANVQKSIFSFLSDNRSLDPFLIEFGSFYEGFKTLFRSPISVGKFDDKKFNEIITKILNSAYVREKDKDFLFHDDGRKVNLSNASSGQQETLPLIVILKALNVLNFYSNGATIYIEEPEAHLYPNAQKAIVQLLARTFNHKTNKFQIIVTTHSPYILSSFNNLLEAGRLEIQKPDKSKSISKIIPKEEQIGVGITTVYSINKGKKDALIDNESNLITSTILDGVSNEIAEDFGKLLDIEF